jgi:hypothetical protein
MKKTTEQALIRQSKAETVLAARLLKLLSTPGIEWFFKPHPENLWTELSAQEAWECWLKGQLSEQELDSYEEQYGYELISMSQLRDQLTVDSNRIPGPGNVDGY